MRLGNQPGTGVGKRRRTGIAHQGDVLALAQLGDQLLRASALVVLVQCDGARADAVVGEQGARGARVLAGDHLHRAQGLDGARARVGEIADRRRYNVEGSGQPARLPIR